MCAVTSSHFTKVKPSDQRVRWGHLMAPPPEFVCQENSYYYILAILIQFEELVYSYSYSRGHIRHKIIKNRKLVWYKQFKFQK